MFSSFFTRLSTLSNKTQAVVSVVPAIPSFTEKGSYWRLWDRPQQGIRKALPPGSLRRSIITKCCQWISYSAIMTIPFPVSVEVMVLLSSWVRHHIATKEFDHTHFWIGATLVLCPAHDTGWPSVVRKITLIQVSSTSERLSHPNDKILHLFQNRCQWGTLMVTNRTPQNMSHGGKIHR